MRTEILLLTSCLVLSGCSLIRDFDGYSAAEAGVDGGPAEGGVDGGGPDSGPGDAGSDASLDSGPGDAGSDADVDSGLDSGPGDAGSDASLDSGLDSGPGDAGSDASLDSGVNECTLGTDTCDANATCTDTPTGFTCACSSGYHGDGMSCRVRVTSLAAGLAHTCALLATGDVKCWGDNRWGQLGLGDTNYRGDMAGEMGDRLPTVDLGTGRTATAITAGQGHTCALLDDGSVKCWGANGLGQLGLGDTDNRGDDAMEMGDRLGPIDLGTGRTATAIAAGSDFTCALLDDATVKCWGQNHRGQLGLGDTNHRGDMAGEMGDSLPTVNLGTRLSVTAIAAGSYHACALLDTGDVKCWGGNSSGQLGLGDMNYRGDMAGEMGASLPTVDVGGGVRLLAPGWQHTCALLNNATVKCWGGNQFGALGLGLVTSEQLGDAPDEMGTSLSTVDLGAGVTVADLWTRIHHSCAILSSGDVKCWGRNNRGQLGLGDMDDRGDMAGEMGGALPTVDLGSGLTVTALALGWDHTCALLDTGDVKCWGDNNSGQLGLGNMGDRGDGSGAMGDELPIVPL